MRIPLGRSDDERTVAERPVIRLQNRFFEQDPTNLTDQVSLLSRPGLRKWVDINSGLPTRSVYSCSGTFSEMLFVVQGDTLYGVDRTEAVTTLGTLNTSEGFVSMAATDSYLFLADGFNLYVYDGATLAEVTVPDDDGIISVGVIAGYTICVVAQSGTDPLKNGRFYWIQPAEITIDPLNFATAERSPDVVHSVLVVGDQFWLLGPSTTEVWYPTGLLPPFQRATGRVFDKGTWEGTAIQIKDSVMAVGNDGVVYRIDDQPRVVSTPGVTQRIKDAINAFRNS